MTSIQSLWIELRYKNNVLLICNVYRPPSATVSFWDDFNTSVEKALDENHNLVIVGDINENQLSNKSNKFKHILLLNNLKNIITVPTRVTATTSTLIDPIAISNNLDFYDSGVLNIPSEISDHRSTFVHLKFSFEYIPTTQRTVWIYKKANYEKLNDLINNDHYLKQ